MPEARLRISKDIEYFVSRLKLASHSLRKLEVVFNALDKFDYMFVSDQSRYQYLLEPLADLPIPEVHLEGGVEQGFATKLAGVMTGKFEGELREIDYGSTTYIVGYSPSGRKRRSTEYELEKQRSKKLHRDPKYSWASVTNKTKLLEETRDEKPGYVH